MPLPEPKPEESEDAFVKRCMSDEVMKKEFPKNDQRAAVCYKQYEKNEENEMDIIEKIDKYLNEKKKIKKKNINDYRIPSNVMNKLDRLMYRLYDKDILTKTEKNKKDKIFGKHYRWFNDGDFPRGLEDPRTGRKLSKTDEKNDPEMIHEALNATLAQFVIEMIDKYIDKIDKKKLMQKSAALKLKDSLGEYLK